MDSILARNCSRLNLEIMRDSCVGFANDYEQVEDAIVNSTQFFDVFAVRDFRADCFYLPYTSLLASFVIVLYTEYCTVGGKSYNFSDILQVKREKVTKIHIKPLPTAHNSGFQTLTTMRRLP